MSKAKLITGVFIITVVSYLIASPYIAVANLRIAAEDRDAERLSEYVDFPSLRQSLKDQMNALMAKEMAKEAEKENPFAALGVVFAGTLIDSVVDNYVTPSGIRMLMSGEKPNSVTTSSNRAKEDPEPFAGASKSYESINKFVVTVPGEGTDEDMRFVFRRDVLSWRLTEILLPLD